MVPGVGPCGYSVDPQIKQIVRASQPDLVGRVTGHHK